MAEDTLFPCYEVCIGGIVFINFRQCFNAPPAQVVIIPFIEGIPLVIRRIHALESTCGVIPAVFVEIDAVISRVAENPVKDDAYSVFLPFG